MGTVLTTSRICAVSEAASLDHLHVDLFLTPESTTHLRLNVLIEAGPATQKIEINVTEPQWCEAAQKFIDSNVGLGKPSSTRKIFSVGDVTIWHTGVSEDNETLTLQLNVDRLCAKFGADIVFGKPRTQLADLNSFFCSTLKTVSGRVQLSKTGAESGSTENLDLPIVDSNK